MKTFLVSASILGACLSAPSAVAAPPPVPCTTLDLNAPEDSPLRAMPIYEQDGSGACYAFPAVELVNFELMKAGVPLSELAHPVFAAWVGAYEDAMLFPAPDTRGSYVIDTIQSLRKHGNCPASVVLESLAKFKKISGMTDAQVLTFLELLYENYSGAAKGSDRYKSALDATYAKLKPFVRDACGIVSLAEEIKALNLLEVPATEILSQLFKQCEGRARKPVKTLEPQVHRMGSDLAMKRAIDDSLAGGRPAHISTCGQFILSPSDRWLKSQNPTPFFRYFSGNVKSDCSNHAVTVTARRMIEGSGCMYLIRNSWGAHYRPKDAKCACISRDGAYEDICGDIPAARKVLGCWYKEADTMANTNMVTTFHK